MTKEQYLQLKADLDLQISLLNDKKIELKASYIDACKPCELEDIVEIIRNNDSKVIGKVKTFGLFNDEVFVTSIFVGKSKKVYFTKPYKSIVKTDI